MLLQFVDHLAAAGVDELDLAEEAGPRRIALISSAALASLTRLQDAAVTKADLIDALAEQAGLTKVEAETVVETVFDRIADALAKGDKVEVRGFGSFRIRHRQPRIGRNPKVGTAVEVPAKRVPHFKVGKELQEAINKPG